MLTARLPNLRDRQKVELEKEAAVAELVGESLKPKAKALKVKTKVGNIKSKKTKK